MFDIPGMRSILALVMAWDITASQIFTSL